MVENDVLSVRTKGPLNLTFNVKLLKKRKIGVENGLSSFYEIKIFLSNLRGYYKIFYSWMYVKSYILLLLIKFELLGDKTHKKYLKFMTQKKEEVRVRKEVENSSETLRENRYPQRTESRHPFIINYFKYNVLLK